MGKEIKIKVKGEMLHCRKCKKVKVVEHLIPLKVFLCKDEIKIQESFSIRELAPDYNYEKEGYYKHSYGICEECMRADEKGIILSGNHPLLGYWKAVSAFERRANRIKNRWIDEYIMQISKIAADKISYERFVRRKEFKRNNYLNNENRINLEKLASFYKRAIETEKDKKLSKLKERVLLRERDAADFLENYDDIITCYILDDNRPFLKLRTVDVKRMKRVCPGKILTNSKFYNSFKYSKKVFVNDLNDKERFNVIKESDLEEVFNWSSLALQEIIKLLP